MKGNVKIAVADDIRKVMTLKELVEKSEGKKKIKLYSAIRKPNSKTKKMVWSRIKREGLMFPTGLAKVLYIDFIDPASREVYTGFGCLPDKLIGMPDGNYEEAIALEKGQIVQSFNDKKVLEVKSTSLSKKSVEVMDIFVENAYNFYVILKRDNEEYGKSIGFLVHNSPIV